MGRPIPMTNATVAIRLRMIAVSLFMTPPVLTAGELRPFSYRLMMAVVCLPYPPVVFPMIGTRMELMLPSLARAVRLVMGIKA